MPYTPPAVPTPAALGLSSDGTTLTLNGVAARVLVDSYRKGEADRGPWREIRYKVGREPGDSGYATTGSGSGGDLSDSFIDALLGEPPTVSGGGTPVLSLPMRHRYPGNPNLFCMSADSTHLGPLRPDPAKVVNCDWWEITARYEVPEFDIAGAFPNRFVDGYARPWASVSREGYVEEVPVKVDDLQFKTRTAYTPEGGINVRLRSGEYTYKRTMIPDFGMFDAVCAPLEGCINSAVFWDGGNFPGYAVGTVLMDRYRGYEETASDGSIYFTFEIVYKVREIDWNAVPVPGAVEFDVVGLPGPGSTFLTEYEYADITVPITWGY